MNEYGIQVITVSMPPGIMQVALIMDLVKLSLGILCDERKYKLVLVSKGGFHRAGTVAACILCALGSPPEQAMRFEQTRTHTCRCSSSRWAQQADGFSLPGHLFSDLCCSSSLFSVGS